MRHAMSFIGIVATIWRIQYGAPGPSHVESASVGTSTAQMGQGGSCRHSEMPCVEKACGFNIGTSTAQGGQGGCYHPSERPCVEQPCGFDVSTARELVGDTIANLEVSCLRIPSFLCRRGSLANLVTSVDKMHAPECHLVRLEISLERFHAYLLR